MFHLSLWLLKLLFNLCVPSAASLGSTHTKRSSVLMQQQTVYFPVAIPSTRAHSMCLSCSPSALTLLHYSTQQRHGLDMAKAFLVPHSRRQDQAVTPSHLALECRYLHLQASEFTSASRPRKQQNRFSLVDSTYFDVFLLPRSACPKLLPYLRCNFSGVVVSHCSSTLSCRL